MKIALVASEAAPYSKTGGLADVTGALFSEYAQMGHDVSLFVPLYRETKERFGTTIKDSGIELAISLGGEIKRCRVSKVVRDGGRGAVFFIGNDEFFDRDELYGDAHGDYPDNGSRFVFFCRSVLDLCTRLNLSPDIMHCNDWQTGLIPLYVKTLYRESSQFSTTRSVLTIHNLGYQGMFPVQTMGITGLGWDLFNPEGVEFYGKLNFLKAGIIGADIITTVSDSYAREILTPDFGFGLEGVLRKRTGSLYGVLNGIDYSEWDPSADPFLPQAYNASDLKGKARCKRKLIKTGSLKGEANSPILCFIGRLSGQKGIELLAEIVPELIALGALFVIIGKGEEHYERPLAALKAEFPERIFLTIGFDEALAHLGYAGSDIFLMPSQYEPCGLGQMIAMRYGTLPVARMVGGPADTVEGVVSLKELFCERLFGKTTETGFLFQEYSAQSFLDQIRLALCAYDNEKPWRRMMRNAMSRDFSWKRSAQKYLDLYSGKMV